MSEGAHVHPKGSRVKSVAVAQAPRCPFICIWLYDCVCMFFIIHNYIHIFNYLLLYIYMFILLYIYVVWFYRRHVVASLDMMLNNECSRPCKKQPSPLSKDPPSNFPYKMGGLKATKWVFMGRFVVRPPCEKVQGPLQLWMASHFVEKNAGAHGWR